MSQETLIRAQVEKQLEKEVFKIARRDDKASILYYFENLNHLNPGQFPRYWDQIAQAGLTPHEHTKVLHDITRHIKNPKISVTSRGKMLSHIRSHIDLWAKPAVNNHDGLKPAHSALSSWSLAALDTLYRRDSLKGAFEAIRKNIDVTKLTDFRNRKQLRDAELWFLEETNIENPRNQQQGTTSELERKVKRVFSQMNNMDLIESDTPYISEFPQAIDFALRYKEEHNIWMEIDGINHYHRQKNIKAPSSKFVTTLSSDYRNALLLKYADPQSRTARVDMPTAVLLRNGSHDKSELAESILQKVVDSPPGIYRTFTDNPNVIMPAIHRRFAA